MKPHWERGQRCSSGAIKSGGATLFFSAAPLIKTSIDRGVPVRALEAVKGQRWEEFSARHGDWGRDAARWLGRKRGGYRLGELGEWAGGLDYAAAGQAVSRSGGSWKSAASSIKLKKQLSNVGM